MKAMDFELICLEETDLAQKIAKRLNKKLHAATFQQFADGEINIVLPNPELFRDTIAVLIQSTGVRVNEHTLGVAYCAHELKNAGAYKVIAVIPYLGYARQERSTITGKLGQAAVVAQLFQASGIDELVAVELHELSLIDLFSIPVHHIRLQQTIVHDIQRRLLPRSLFMIAPDQGAQAYVNEIAHELGVSALLFEKERYGKDKTRIIGDWGSCEHSNEYAQQVGVMVDDIIATGGTAINVCNMLCEQGFTTIYGYFVHPVLAGPALERLKESHFAKIFVSNTLPLSAQAYATGLIELFDVSDPIIEKLQEVLYEYQFRDTHHFTHHVVK
jgi:ribose-phosphate pyrophosphokinase